MRHTSQNKYLATLLLILSVLFLICINSNTLIAQAADLAEGSSSANDGGELSGINWDEEDTTENEGDADLKENLLQKMMLIWKKSKLWKLLKKRN